MLVTRFAPSPTGALHLGHAYAALYAHELARSSGGRFLLRFEDIDHTRVREEYYADIKDDLRWLGITWPEPALRQSTRMDAYAAALGHLQEGGMVYPCFCTRREIADEIARMGHAPHGPEGPLYPGTCRSLGKDECEERIAAGEGHCWRLDADRAGSLTGLLTFTDNFHGTIPVEPGLLGDVVLARKDIATSYHLAVVVDDAFQGVTDVTRGEDLLDSTHVHRLLQALLGLPEPSYHHHRLVTDENGRRLATRDHARSLRYFRHEGHSPKEVLAMLPEISLNT
jgi:glutamyl-Q tRNA(Asp) synthetase